MTHRILGKPAEKAEALERARQRAKSASSLLFVTGAGISVESGLPTYRGVGGLYSQSEVEDGYSIEELVSQTVFSTRPDLTWKYLLEIARAAHSAHFNRAHSVIAELEKTRRVVTLTQNVDGFHRAAGQKNVIDIHGDLSKLYCQKCRARSDLRYADIETLPPHCACGGVIRPDVVLFDEYLPPEKVSRLEAELEKGFDMVISVGTSSLFGYIIEPVLSAIDQGIPTLEINPGWTDLSSLVEVKLALGATEALVEVFGRRP